jgi:NAD(P)-dependent dehydrogenase (short-subunit alcohol dehydrogenase family)
MTKPTAFITGGADRIGRAIALHLAHLGYDIIIHYNRSTTKAENTQRDIKALGVSCEIVQIDFSQSCDFEAILKDLSSRHQIEVLVNNASDYVPSTIQDDGLASFHHHTKINFEVPYLLTKAFAKCASKGCIINIIDAKTEKNQTLYFDYLLSKKLLRDFTLLAAYHLAPQFRVNGVSPGLVLEAPPLARPEGYVAAAAKKLPLQTAGTFAQIQSAVAFFIQNEAITGQIIYIDGGNHL